MVLTILLALTAPQSVPLPALPAEAQGRWATPLKPKTSPGNWVTPNDYPSTSLSRKEFGIVVFRLDVDGQGKVTDCHILVSSGFWLLDQRTCSVLMKRARFSGARDSEGNPIPATFQSNFFWIMPGATQDYVRLANEVAPVMQLVVSVNRLPAAYQTPALVRVQFGDDGTVAACSVEVTSGSGTLDQIACQQARRDVSKPPFRKGLVRQPDTRMVGVGFLASAKLQ